MRLRVLISCFIFVSGFTQVFGGQWQLINSADGVRIYRQKQTSTKYHRFKAVGVIRARASKVFTLVQDVKLMPKWVEGAKDVRLLKKNFNAQSYNLKLNEYYQIFYARSKVPWPFEDRDYIMKGKVDFSPKKNLFIINLRDIKYKGVGPKKGVTRMKFLRLRFSFEPINNGKHTRVEFVLHVNPGGRLPPWVVNFMSKREPLKTIKKLRSLANRNNYNRAIEKLALYHWQKLSQKKK